MLQKTVKSLLVGGTVLLCSISAQAVEPTPRFSDYPAKVVDMSKTPRHQAVITEQNSHMRTRLQDLAKNATVNFAGRYAIKGVGCGGGCVLWLSMDLTTGKELVEDMPAFVYCKATDQVDLLNRADSRLMAVVARTEDDTIEQCFVHYYVENQGTLTLLKKTPWAEDNVESLRQTLSTP